LLSEHTNLILDGLAQEADALIRPFHRVQRTLEFYGKKALRLGATLISTLVRRQ